MLEIEEITFDSRLFSVDAVKNAAYRLANLIDSDIRLDGCNVVCTVRLRKENAEEAMTDVLERFRREVIDHDLRLQIRHETEGERNLILAHAFSRTGIVPSE
jgi:His-Xaa-Ser system protein HxsD